MTSYVSSPSGGVGDYFNDESWTPSGIPGSGDTVVINGDEIIVRAGQVFHCKGPDGADAVTGSSDSNRGILTVKEGGMLRQSGEFKCGIWGKMNFEPGSFQDLNTNAFKTNSDGGNEVILDYKGTPDNRVTISSEPNTGSFTRNNGNMVEAACTFHNVDFLDVFDPRIGKHFNEGNFLDMENCLFVGCGKVQIGATRNLANIHRYVDNDIRQSRSTEADIALIRYQPSGSGSALTEFHGNTIEATPGPTAYRWKFSLPDFMDMDHWIVDAVSQSLSPGGIIFTNSFFTLRDGVSGADNSIDIGNWVDERRDCVYFIDRDNGHFFTGAKYLIEGGCLVVDPVVSTDRPDIFMVAKDVSVVATMRGVIIQDRAGGVVANALGAPDADGTYKLENCTFRGPYDDAYGSVARDEGGGAFGGGLYVCNTIVYATIADPDIRGFNLTVGDDKVAEIRNNAWVNVEDPYHNVTSTTFTAGVEDIYGGQDFHDVDPEFVDPDRDYKTWDASLGGAGTNQGAIDKLLARNGTAPGAATKTVEAISGVGPEDFNAHMRDGFTPQNILFKDTGYTTGAPIHRGAVPYAEASSGFGVTFPPTFHPTFPPTGKVFPSG